jgi:unsaturated rhamnogalacturonyl hydrolase
MPEVPPDPEVTAIMIEVADWQLDRFGDSTASGWGEGAMWTGIMATYYTTGEERFLDAALSWGEANNWELGEMSGSYFTNADNQCAAQTYFELYLLDPIPANEIRVNVSKSSFDTQVAEGRVSWGWVDALFMAPPALARLYAATGDTAYLDLLHTGWSNARGSLYREAYGLWWRDPHPTQPDNDIFWSRGNGWVMAGSVRVLQYLPQDDPQRSMYVDNITAMAAALVPLQQSDGLWRADLLHPEGYPNPESSGSAFFTYAMAWGINQGILDRDTYLPVVLAAWEGLVGCVQPDGSFGYVQPPGWEPGPSDANNTSNYGAGAFLLAGSEVAKL